MFFYADSLKIDNMIMFRNFDHWFGLLNHFFFSIIWMSFFDCNFNSGICVAIQKYFFDIIELIIDLTGDKVQNLWPLSPALYTTLIVFSCLLIGSLTSSTANQRAAQNNCYIESDFGDPSMCTNYVDT